uniref:Leucine rich immune protein (Coil-less) n=1 Tax=Anopheles christyi TaxID=43041 RepID=A0A182KBN2_9DIPT
MTSDGGQKLRRALKKQEIVHIDKMICFWKILNLSNNLIRQLIPVTGRSGRTLSFEQLLISDNQLELLDMAVFVSMPLLSDRPLYLEESNCARGSVDTCYTAQSVPVRLAVAYLELSDNKITTFNIAGCDMPNITSLFLDDNRLTVIPSIFERYAKTRIIMDGNPLSCNTLLPFKDRLTNDQLRKEQRSVSMECVTTSSFLVDETVKVCCDK